MQASEPVQRVRIYLSERDTAEGRPLYLAVLETLQREGATGATALRGAAGFGAGSRRRVAAPGELTEAQPLVIEWVDRAERVARVLPLLDEMLPEALITLEEVRVYRAILRSGGPFGDKTVGDAANTAIITVGAGAQLAEAIRLLVECGQPALPVLSEAGLTVGVLQADDLVRAGTPALPVLRALPAEERSALLAAVPAQPLATFVAPSLRAVAESSAIPQAIGMLVEWGLEALPVVDRGGRCVGLFGGEQALRVVVQSSPAPGGPIRDADPPPPVRLVMQSALPALPLSSPAAEALARLRSNPEGFVVLLDDGRPAAVLSEDHLLASLTPGQRTAWLSPPPAASQAVPAALVEAFAQLPAGALPHLPAPTIGALEARDRAIQQLLDGLLERLVVVDEQGRALGIVGRRGLLRALAQESAG